MDHETRKILREAQDALDEAVRRIHRDRSYQYPDAFLKVLDQAQCDLSFLYSAYDLSLYLEENPEKQSWVYDPNLNKYVPPEAIIKEEN